MNEFLNKIGLVIFILIVQSCVVCKGVNHYLPTIMEDLSKEQILLLSTNEYMVKSITTKNTGVDYSIFSTNGDIKVDNKILGNWNNRIVSYKDPEMEFYITKISNGYIRLISNYKICNDKTVYTDAILISNVNDSIHFNNPF